MANPIPSTERALVMIRCMGRCERCGSPVRNGEMHHRRGKAVRDEHTHHPCNMVYLCGFCHRWAHAQPLLARSTGFIVSRHTPEPGTVPLAAHYGALLLACDGMIQFSD